MSLFLNSPAGRLRCVLPKRLLLAALAVGVLATGCRTQVPHNLPSVSVRTAAFAASSAIEAQSSPLYRQARQACKQGDYRHAADLLQQLAQTPGLTPDALAFCTAQRNIC
jgi:hypothetical protein